MMPTFPRSPLSFRTAGFPRYGCKADISDGAFPDIASLRLLPAYTGKYLVCVRPSCTSWRHRLSRTVSGRALDRAPSWRLGRPPPQGSSLWLEFCCLEPSSLNRPHPPHPRAHRDFTAWRLIRNAFAVRERRGDPRVVPGFRYHSFLACRSLGPRGARSSLVQTSMPTSPSPRSEQLGTPNLPAIRFTRGTSFGTSRFTH